MKFRTALAGLLTLALLSTAYGAPTQYQATLIATWGSGALNNQGDVVGTVIYPATEGPAYNFHYRSDGSMLTIPAGFDYGSVYTAINDAGQILTQKNLIQPDGTIAPHEVSNAILANSLNKFGQFTGSATGNWRPFIAGNGKMTMLDVSGEYNFAMGASINDLGDVTGYMRTDPGTDGRYVYRGFIYEDGQMTELPELPEQVGPYQMNERRTWGLDINNHGAVVGSSNGRSFIYQNGIMTELPALPGYAGELSYSDAWSINDKGQIVGRSNNYAFLHQDGETFNLNDLLIEKDAPNWVLRGASGINEKGQILATGEYYGQFGPTGFEEALVLLTPVSQVPEPANGLMAICGLSLLLARGLRRQRCQTQAPFGMKRW